MKTTTLTLNEILSLETELSGFVHPENQQVILKGLVNQKLSLAVRFHLRSLLNGIKDHVKNVQDLRNEMIKTLGNEDDKGNVQILPSIKDEDGKDVVNPVFIEFNKQISELLAEQKEIAHHDFKIEDFKDVITEESYSVFDKLISI